MRTLLTCVLLLVGCAHARTVEEYRADTAKVLAVRDTDLKACYDRVLSTTPDASGSVTVDFALEPKTGKVADVRLDTTKTTAPTAVSQCVLDLLPTLAIAPGDRKRGEAKWSWNFDAKPATVTN